MKERKGLRPRLLGKRGLGRAGFSGLADPGFVLSPSGDILEANRAGLAFLSALPSLGAQGSVGREELSHLFRRAAASSLEPSPFQVAGSEGSSYFEARFGPADQIGRKSVILTDVSIWKRALAEKDLLIQAIRSETEKPVTVCARCGAIKDKEGRWSPPGALAASALAPERLSHGLCPSCLNEELGHAGVELPQGPDHLVPPKLLF